MVLGRLLNVNGKQTESDSFQRFPVRLSYRDKRIPSERLVAGHEFTGRFNVERDEMAEISVEAGFAERNHFKIGDVLEFDVQSVPIKARIVNLRHVQWTSFNPNFFIQFQPGVLDDAPKTWVANVHLAGDEATKVFAQFALTRDFPNISVIDIGRTISRVLEIAHEVIGPVRAAAICAVVMSFMILLGVVAHNLRMRDAEIGVEKLLGADARLIRRLMVGEYAVTALFAWLVGASAAMVLAWVVMRQMFDIPLQLSGLAVIASGAATVIVTVAIAFFSSTRVLNQRGTK